MKVYKSVTIPIKTTKENEQYFFECNKECGRVWNECIRLNKALWELDKHQVDRKYLQDNLRGFSKILTAKSIQMVTHRYLRAIVAIKESRKTGRLDLKFPWREKKYFNTIVDIQNLQINYEKSIIRIPRPVSYNKIVNGKIKPNPIWLKCKTIPQNITQVEFIYKNGWKLAINYFIEEECLQIKSENICAVDLGEIHSITNIDTYGNTNIITGRELRSTQRFRNKELGKLNRKLSKCKKNSRNYKKYRKAIIKLSIKSDSKIEDNLKKTAKLFTNYAIFSNISTIVIGDLKNFNMNQKSQKRSKGQKQKLVQWEYGKLIDKIKNNVNKYGVEVVEISERYTSQTCPSCGNKHKPLGRNYVCKCGFTMHRDVVGAYNILSKYINNGEIKNLNIDVKPIKYLRIA